MNTENLEEKIPDGKPLRVTTEAKLFDVAPGLIGRYKRAFQKGNGEIVVQCSNFTKTPKYFKIIVEEVDEKGNSLVKEEPKFEAKNQAPAADQLNSSNASEKGGDLKNDKKDADKAVK